MEVFLTPQVREGHGGCRWRSANRTGGSLVIESLCDGVGGECVAVVGQYCNFLTQQEQSTVNMLGPMLKQLARRGGIPEQIREAF